MTYMWSIKIVNIPAFSVAYNLEDLRKELKYWRKKYPNGRIKARRFTVIDGIDRQMKTE